MSGPLAQPSPLPFEAPVFDKLTNACYRPAIVAAMELQLTEIDHIVANEAAPTFENTIVAMEKSGRDLARATKIFFALTSSATDDDLQATKAELVPLLTAHNDAISLNDALFQRVKSVYNGLPNAGITPPRQRLVERYHARFVRAGALLNASEKDVLKKLNEEVARLCTRFSDNILKARSNAAVLVEQHPQLDGLDKEAMETAAALARSKGHTTGWLIELINTTTQPVLASLKDRGLRERIHKASLARNTSGETDNSAVVGRLAQLRAQKAKLLGFPNWAAYVMDDQMAKTPKAALELLAGLVPAAVRNARQEAAKLQLMLEKDMDATHQPSTDRTTGNEKPGSRSELMAWDWDYYSERMRKDEYDLEENAIKPYLNLESVLVNGVFFAAEKLYGLTFNERHDLPVYHPDVRVFDIIDTGGVVLGLFYGDYYARDNKQGGAWMDSFVDQSTLLGQQPVITQNCNYVKPAPGQPCLLSFDDVITLFHEFGHALHGLLSRQEYPFFSGTATSTDFVEFPSQLNEYWAMEPRILGNYARHYRTGEPMPTALLEKVRSSSRFNQGFKTSEYLAAALLDIEWHMLAGSDPLVADVEAFEQGVLQKYGLLNTLVPPRYKTCYFSHSWSGGYAANYYAYMWSEVLDADGCAWFEEHGGLTRANGMHFRNTILAQGGSKDGNELYRDLTGRDPRLEPLLKRRGLL